LHFYEEIAVWNAARVLLLLGVVLGLLCGAVLFVLAILVLLEGKIFQFSLAVGGGLLSWLISWLFGRGAARIKHRVVLRAIAEHKGAIGLQPLSAVAHNNQGVACHQNGEFAKAVAHFEAAIRLNSENGNAFVGRVNAYGALGLWDRVIAEYTEAIARDPKDMLAYCARATAFNAIGRWDRSIPDASAAIRLARDLYLGYDARGYGYLQRGSFNWIIKAIAITWMVATFAYLRRDHFDWRTPTGSRVDYEQAIADFTEAIRLNPSASDCYMGRAQARRALGQHDDAALDEDRARAV